MPIEKRNWNVQFKEMNPVCVSALRVIVALMMIIDSLPLFSLYSCVRFSFFLNETEYSSETKTCAAWDLVDEKNMFRHHRYSVNESRRFFFSLSNWFGHTHLYTHDGWKKNRHWIYQIRFDNILWQESPIAI